MRLKLVSLTSMFLTLWTSALLALPRHSPELVSLKFPAPTQLGAPNSTSGAGSRNLSCFAGESRLQVIAPTVESQTTLKNPSLFVYVPETFLNKGELIMVDAQGNDIFSQTIPLPGQAAILALALPESVSLAVNQVYTWQFSVQCPIAINYVDYVEAKITRIQPDALLLKQLADAKTPLAKAEHYAQKNIWQDTLMMVASVQSTQSDDWKELLGSIGLASLDVYSVKIVPLK